MTNYPPNFVAPVGDAPPYRTKPWLIHWGVFEMYEALRDSYVKKFPATDRNGRKGAKRRAFLEVCEFAEFREAAEQKRRLVKEKSEVDWTTLRSKTDTSSIAAVRWVSNHLDDPETDFSTAPSPAAVSLLLWAREDRKEFFKQFAGQFVASELKADKGGDDDAAGSRHVFEDLESYLAAVESGSEPAALPAGAEGSG